MRGLTSTILLVVVLAGVGGYIYFVDSTRPAGGVEDKAKVFAVEADAVEELTVSYADETTTLRKTDGAWKVTAPVTVDADATEVSSLTSGLNALEVNRVVDENAANLAEYGLDPPRVKVAFKAGGTSGELHLGEKTATQSDVYAVKAGEKRVFLVAAFQETTFTKKTFDLRDKRALHFERDKIDSIELAAGAGPAIQIARAGSEWVVKAPVQARADYSAVEGLLTRLSSASMTKLVDTSGPETFGLDTPSARITVGAGSTRATLEFGAEAEGAVYARDSSRQIVFAIDPALAADAKKPVGEYRDKELFEFRNFNALRLRIIRGSETIEFQKVAASGETPEKWQRIASGKTTDVESTKMEDLLTKLTSMRAQSFNPGIEGAKPALTVAVSYDGDKFERVQVLEGGTAAIAVRDGEPGAAVLDQTAYEDLRKALDAAVAP